MKQDFRVLSRDRGGYTEIIVVRVLAEAEGWALVRRKGAAPFVARSSELGERMAVADQKAGRA